jgi:DNA-binding MarR family transcriptional regulator
VGKVDEFGLQLGQLPEMVTMELRIGQILAEGSFMAVSHTRVSPGLFMILALIKSNPGQKQSTLAQSVKLDRSTLVPIMDHCERRGWVERKPFIGDRRAHAIHLTSKGRTLVNKLETSVAELEKRITEGMGQQDRDQFLLLLKKFQAAVTA